MKKSFRNFTFALAAAVFGCVGFKMLSPTQVVALASMSHDLDVRSPTRIDALPPELPLERSCGAVVRGKARRTSFESVRDPFHRDAFPLLPLREPERPLLGSECLHEAYVRSGSSFRLALSIHAVDLKMTQEGDMAGIEVTTAHIRRQSSTDGTAVASQTPARICAERKPAFIFGVRDQ
jgi:hypothetical protein